MTVLALIRHGPTEWNAQKRLQGHSDTPLSAEGRQEVADRVKNGLTSRLNGFCWLSSPLRRARATAELLSGSPTTLEDRLIEMDWGDWEGRTLADLRAELGEALQINEDNGLDFRPDGGESPRGVQDRLRPWLVEIAGEGRDVAAVTHKGVIRALMAEAYGWEMMGTPPVKLDWTRLHLFHIDAEGRPEPVEMNIPLGLGGQEP